MRTRLCRILLIIASLSTAKTTVAVAETVAVSGVAVDQQGQRAMGATAYLCYAKGTKNGVASDPISSRGVFALVRENVLDDLKTVFVVVAGDATHEDAFGEVTLIRTPDKLLIGKSPDIVRRDKPPASVSFRAFSTEEAVTRLRDIEVAKTLLVRNGIKTQEEVEASYKEDAIRILANLRGGKGIDIGAILPDVKSGVETVLKDKGEIGDDLRATIPRSEKLKRLQDAEFDFRADLLPGKKLPDDVVKALVGLPNEAITTEQIRDLLEQRLVVAKKDGKLVGVFHRLQPAADSKTPASIFELTPSMDVSAKATEFLGKHPEIKKSLLLDALKNNANSPGEKELLKNSLLPAELRFFEHKP